MAKLKLDRTESHYRNSSEGLAGSFGSSTSAAEQQTITAAERPSAVSGPTVVAPALVVPTSHCLICKFRRPVVRRGGGD